MDHRERILTALRHKEPDRVPVDLGAMDSTGIMAVAYNRLKANLGLAPGHTRMYDPYQQVTEVEDPVLEWVGADVKPVYTGSREWRPSRLPDGSPCEVPLLWRPETRADGSHVIRGSAGEITAIMPSGGLYFEPVSYSLRDAVTIADVERRQDLFETADWPFFADETFADLGNKARALHENTHYALMGNFAVHVFAGAQMLRGFDTFLMDLLLDPPLAECIMDHLVEVYIRRFDRYVEAVGPYVQIISVNDDMGTQAGPMVSPSLYRRRIKPYQGRLYRYIKSHFDGYLFLHSDGDISQLIPDLIENGVDIISPVQFTAANMDLGKLKAEFGRDITFWGGGCDTQQVLPYGTPQEVRDEVKRRIDTLAPGGGFVFNQVHNIQADVPPENVAAMYEAVAMFGGYA
jgi:uroporphyrinogen decarboxylase